MDLGAKFSEHFTVHEMVRSETAARKGIDNIPPAALIPKLQKLCADILEPVRARFGKPFRPNSGYRSPELNTAVGGSARSQHCLAEAVDIEIAGVSNFELAAWVKENLAFDKLILECYTPGLPNSGWVHVSYRENNNRNQVMTYSNGNYLPGLIA